MIEFESEAKKIGKVTLPEYTGKTIMMMPFLVEDSDSLSPAQIGGWKNTIKEILKDSKAKGIGYITIDEAIVEKGRTHRRPGLHVDGYKLAAYGGGNPYGGSVYINPYGGGIPNIENPYGGPIYENAYGGGIQKKNVPYGGSVAAYAGSLPNSGMFLVASNNGTRAFVQKFKGSPGIEGDCEHLKEQCKNPIVFKNSEAWWCSGLLVHEGVPASENGPRQILHISMPSSAPFHWPYTPNITGIKPVTNPGPNRHSFMSYKEN